MKKYQAKNSHKKTLSGNLNYYFFFYKASLHIFVDFIGRLRFVRNYVITENVSLPSCLKPIELHYFLYIQHIIENYVQYIHRQ